MKAPNVSRSDLIFRLRISRIPYISNRGRIGGALTVRVSSGSCSSVNFNIENPHPGVADMRKFGSPTTKVQYWDPRCTS